MPTGKDFEGGYEGTDVFESYASEHDGDTDLDHQIRSVFNHKNLPLLEKNKDLLEQVDDERNDKIKEFVE